MMTGDGQRGGSTGGGATAYAILHHTGIAAPHYDLLFETLPGSALAAWRCPCWPIESAQRVVRLKDHRRVYLQYEGDLGGRRGHVTRVAGGWCRVHAGEAQAWTITLLSGASPVQLTLRHLADVHWEARSEPPPPAERER